MFSWTVSRKNWEFARIHDDFLSTVQRNEVILLTDVDRWYTGWHQCQTCVECYSNKSWCWKIFLSWKFSSDCISVCILSVGIVFQNHDASFHLSVIDVCSHITVSLPREFPQNQRHFDFWSISRYTTFRQKIRNCTGRPLWRRLWGGIVKLSNLQQFVTVNATAADGHNSAESPSL